MSSVPPPSQSGVPSSGGNGTYIAIAILLLLGIGGIAAWKLTQKPSAPPPTPTVASTTPSASASAVSTSLIDEVPLPPPVVDAGPPPKVVYVQSSDPCAATVCNGNISSGSDSERALQMLAHQTRRKCYDPALANDPSIQGHVTVRMKIASNGQICSATVLKNDMPTTSVGECAARMLQMSGHVPAPHGGCVELNFPLNYVPMGQH